MKIGVDFGTTYTKIMYPVSAADLRAFEYPPGDAGSKFIPTAVAYRKQNGSLTRAAIGQAARRLALDEDDVVLFQNFKMMLPLAEKDWAKHGWASSDKSPSDVATDFFDALMVDGEGAFTRQRGKIESIVMSVPEVWHRRVETPGVERLRSVAADRLKLPLSHLQSEPVCAAAALQYDRIRNKRPFSGNLLVCDVGGGTFDVALCELAGKKITVLEVDGNGQEGLGTSGVMFDRNIAKLAFAAVNGAPPAPDDPEYLELVHEFEQTKIQNSEALKLLKLKIMPSNSPIYRIKKKYRVTPEQFTTAFAPIRTGIGEVLERLRDRIGKKRLGIDGVMVVGGFGQFAPVRDAIAEALGSDASGRDKSVVQDTERDHLAIAHGAALIANGLIETEERYPHTIGVRASFLHDGTIRPGVITIIEGGKVPLASQGTLSKFAEANGQPIPTELQHTGRFALPVVAKMMGLGDWVELQVPAGDLPPTGQYHIGVEIDRSQILSLLFRPAAGGQQQRYTIGRYDLDLIVRNVGGSS